MTAAEEEKEQAAVEEIPLPSARSFPPSPPGVGRSVGAWGVYRIRFGPACVDVGVNQARWEDDGKEEKEEEK